VGEIIQKDLISLDVDKINFDDKESVKSLIITLLNVVEQLLQENRQLRAELPKDVQSTQFGSDLKALVAVLYYVGRVTENKIHSILTDFGTIISEGEISNILTKEKSEAFAAEKADIFQMGMMRANYFQTDETGARHQGKNYYMHYFGNEKFSTYFIEKNKSRATIRKIFGLLEGVLERTPMTTDGARQYIGIAIWHALCWIHEIRFYKKLKPYLDFHRLILEKDHEIHRIG